MKNFLVLGGGSAGLLAALTLKRCVPGSTVTVVRSPEIGVIGVGESTTPNLPMHLFQYLGLSRKRFYALAEPTWKMGIRFLWGPRKSFEYSFDPQLDVRHPELPRPNGYYCDDDFTNMCVHAALMTQDKCFPRQPNGAPDIQPCQAFHLENPKLVKALEVFSREDGIEFIDAKVKGAETGAQGIAAVILEDGRRLTADFYIDASGFRSELLGRTLNEPYIPFNKSLFNDRAVVGHWKRTDADPTLPYTTAETMDAGWCWRIDHQPTVNRGYVYSSAAISDDQAREELVRKNPKIDVWDHIIKFKTGRYQRGWVGNCMAIGNASGFVEPLESTALMVVCWQIETFVELTNFVGPTPSVRDLFNTTWAATWDEIRDFLTLHFWSNTLIDTPYWRHCRNDADISRLKTLLDFYEENGPTGFSRYNLKNTGSQFGIEGFLVMLVGTQHPYRNRHKPTPAELEIMNGYRARFKTIADTGLTVAESLAYVMHPNWRWFGDPA